VNTLESLYPAIAALDATPRTEVLAVHAQRMDVPAGTVLFDEGAPCRGFPLVLAGEIRVARLFGQAPMTAHGTATLPSELVLLSAAGFDRWAAHAAFRRFVFGVFADRLADLMALAEAVAFQRMDQRLAAALLGRGSVVHATHQALADELGTVREIVTRLLKRFERAGWVRVARERIELLDAPALRELAAAGARPAD
jgi:CRP/FNR family transcriptional regulator, anaerobic regulatory protein